MIAKRNRKIIEGALKAESESEPAMTLLLARVALGLCKDWGARCDSGRGTSEADSSLRIFRSVFISYISGRFLKSVESELGCSAGGSGRILKSGREWPKVKIAAGPGGKSGWAWTRPPPREHAAATGARAFPVWYTPSKLSVSP